MPPKFPPFHRFALFTDPGLSRRGGWPVGPARGGTAVHRRRHSSDARLVAASPACLPACLRPPAHLLRNIALFPPLRSRSRSRPLVAPARPSRVATPPFSAIHVSHRIAVPAWIFSMTVSSLPRQIVDSRGDRHSFY